MNTFQIALGYSVNSPEQDRERLQSAGYCLPNLPLLCCPQEASAGIYMSLRYFPYEQPA
jgi:hypothetical protein